MNFYELILHNVKFDEYAVDKHGKVRLTRHHRLHDSFAQISPRRKSLSIWVRPNWVCWILSIIIFPYSTAVAAIAFFATAGWHKDKFRTDILEALKQAQTVEKINFSPPVMKAPPEPPKSEDKPADEPEKPDVM